MGLLKLGLFCFQDKLATINKQYRRQNLRVLSRLVLQGTVCIQVSLNLKEIL